MDLQGEGVSLTPALITDVFFSFFFVADVKNTFQVTSLLLTAILHYNANIRKSFSWVL